MEGINCDSFTLNVSGTAADWTGRIVKVEVRWLAPGTDYDVYVHKGSVTGPEVTHAAEGTTTEEKCEIDPSVSGTGTYVVRVVYWAATAADQYSGVASVTTKPVIEPPPPSSAEPPTYRAFVAPAPLGQSAGEPSIGLSASGRAFFLSELETLRVTFNDANPAGTLWENKPATNTSLATFDPILFTDPYTHRTFVSQLLPTKASLMSFTDDEGETWTPSMGSGINSGVDHQTIGGGPFRPGVLGRGPITPYPNAVYYASQDIGLAEIALSRDGGQTFELAVPMWNLTQCSGLHGHIKVAPDGTVYVPNKSCSGRQGVAVSEDNGLTWAIRTVPGSTPGETDPSVGIGSDGTVYFGFANGDGTAKVAVSRDRGLTWRQPYDVGYALGIRNIVFPAMAAGDPDRAAYFFLGSTTAGAAGTGTDRAFDGTWYGYIATTYDRGQTWVTVNATAGDPVQRGVICTAGTTCASNTRNLLDFNDLEIDRLGRPHAAFADGCVSAACIQGQDRSGPSGTPDGKLDG
ncbi:MAG TPA: sialidase family protein, partial [Nonomuraea sp.]|nr:sialidase family protein [Nonomuraea sp.]